MSYVIIIPARYHSTRLPAKVLLDIAGKPMIEHVYDRALESNADAIYVATDHQAIMDWAKQKSIAVVQTSTEHSSGTERINEAAGKLGLSDDTIIVGLQADEPLIDPSYIDIVANSAYHHKDVSMCTLATKIFNQSHLDDPHIVKVILNTHNHAIYFTRANVNTFSHQSIPTCIGKHLGIYAYRKSFLQEYINWEPSPLEQFVCLEQLRVLYYGGTIHVDTVDADVMGIDTMEDYEAICKKLSGK